MDAANAFSDPSGRDTVESMSWGNSDSYLNAILPPRVMEIEICVDLLTGP